MSFRFDKKTSCTTSLTFASHHTETRHSVSCEQVASTGWDAAPNAMLSKMKQVLEVQRPFLSTSREENMETFCQFST